MIAGIETGGTKTIAAVASATDPQRMIDSIEFPTTTPADVVDRIHKFLARHEPIAHIGLASFGPLDLDPASRTYGSIMATPKEGWSYAPLLTMFGLQRSITIVSDVTGAAVGESAFGGTADIRDSAYITVGTGIGVGVVHDGRPAFATSHPELGHISVRRHPADEFAGVCPFHGDCAEGLASGPAISARWNRSTRELQEDLQAAIEIEAHYLGQLVATVSYAYMPQRVTLGGGVLKIPGLHQAVRTATLREIGGALGREHDSRDPVTYLVSPALGDFSGVLGALQLAASTPDDRQRL